MMAEPPTQPAGTEGAANVHIMSWQESMAPEGAHLKVNFLLERKQNSIGAGQGGKIHWMRASTEERENSKSKLLGL